MPAREPSTEPHRVRRGGTGGRPRDPRIDEAALAATRELLAEVGWTGTTMRTIAHRAGVGRPALYRRWPSKAHLVLEALFGWSFDRSPIGEARDAGSWIRNAAENSLELFARPEVRAALPGLLTELGPHEEIRAALWRELNLPAADTLAELLGATETSSDPALDSQAALVLLAGGALYLRLVVPADDAAALEGRLADLLLRGLVPVSSG